MEMNVTWVTFYQSEDIETLYHEQNNKTIEYHMDKHEIVSYNITTSTPSMS